MSNNGQLTIANGELTLGSGNKLAYYDSQAGVKEPAAKAVVLLHGYCGSSAYWRDIVGRLSPDFRVVAPDARGHGASDAPAEEVYEMDHFADDAAELLERIGVTQSILLGHSLGGYITLAYAERYPERLAAFGLVHSTALPDSEAARANRDKAVAALRQDGIAPFVDGLVPKLFNAERSAQLEEQIGFAKRIGYETSLEAAVATAKGMKARPDRQSVITGTKLPVLLAAGAKDGVIPVSSVFAAEAEHGETVKAELPDAGHMSMLECPDELVRILQQFV